MQLVFIDELSVIMKMFLCAMHLSLAFAPNLVGLCLGGAGVKPPDKVQDNLVNWIVIFKYKLYIMLVHQMRTRVSYKMIHYIEYYMNKTFDIRNQ